MGRALSAMVDIGALAVVIGALTGSADVGIVRDSRYEMGNPVWKVVIPLICQPLTNMSATFGRLFWSFVSAEGSS